MESFYAVIEGNIFGPKVQNGNKSIFDGKGINPWKHADSITLSTHTKGLKAKEMHWVLL
jgi:hypothetical protein